MGPLSAKSLPLPDHPRLILLEFDHSRDELWAGLAHHGRPIQYSHVPVPLALWDVWTPIAGPPVAFEPPSAGFAHLCDKRSEEHTSELQSRLHLVCRLLLQ